MQVKFTLRQVNYLPTPEMAAVTQETVVGFSGEDQIQIKYFFQDNGAQEQLLFTKYFKNPNKAIPEFV